MQSENVEIDRIEIRLESSSGDVRIPGFSAGYTVYLAGCEKNAGYIGAFLLVLGFAIAALAIGVLIVSPSTVSYHGASSRSWLQYVQMYAAPIIVVGGALFTLGGHLYSKRVMGREEFLLAIYKLVAPDGKVVTGTVHVGYLGDDDFRIVIE